jgi:phage tail sheath gpL-like
MTLSLALTGFDASNPIPGIYAEVRFAQGETAGDLGPRRVLILAEKGSTGTITNDTQIVGPISDEADAITYAGAGSPAHRMARRFLSLNKGAELYLLCPTTATGTAGTDVVVIATTATGAGVLSVWICGELIQVAIASGDTATVIGDALVLAVNARTHLPVTASNASGTVTLLAKVVGEVGLSIRYRAKVTSGIGTTVTPTADTALGGSGNGAAAAGAGTVSMTASLATMLARKYHYIVPSCQVATPIDAILDQVVTQAEPSTGFRQVVVIGSALTPSNATTLASGSSMNRPRGRIVNQEESPEEHYMLGATAAAVFSKYESSSCSYNFDGFGLKTGQSFPIGAPYNDSARPTTTEIKSMLNNGVTPVAIADNGAAYLVRSVTSYCKNGSNYDYRARDTVVQSVGDRFTDDLVAKLAAAPWTKVTSDPAAGGKEPPAEFATPRRVKSLVEILVSDYVDAGHLDPAKRQTIIDSIQCGIDPQVPSRMNIVCPIYSAVMLHQMAALVKESSAAT